MFPDLKPWGRVAIDDVGVPIRTLETLDAKLVTLAVAAPKLPPTVTVSPHLLW